MNNIQLRCSKCNTEKSFSLESARKFNKHNRYICANCDNRQPDDLNSVHHGHNLVSFPLDNADTIREQIKRNIDPNISLFSCTHGHKTRANCPLCGYQQHKQPSTWNGFELTVLAMIVIIFIVGVAGIILLDPLGPKPYDQDIKTPSAVQVPIDKKCPSGYHRAYPAILCRID